MVLKVFVIKLFLHIPHCYVPGVESNMLCGLFHQPEVTLSKKCHNLESYRMIDLPGQVRMMSDCHRQYR